MEEKHNATPIEVHKMDSGIVGYRWTCSCGRSGNGHHGTMEKALNAAKEHVPLKVCAEIEYNGIHSDICPPGCDFKRIDDDYRKFIHDCLDEWLDKAEGRGIFYISENGYTEDRKIR